MNDDNLKKGKATQFTSGEVAARNGSKGGTTASQNRKKTVNLRRAAQDVLLGTYKDKNGQEMTGQDILVLNLFKIATDIKNKQAIQAMRLLIELCGGDMSPEEKKKLRAEIKLIEGKTRLLSETDTTSLEKLDSILAGIKDSANAQVGESEKDDTGGTA